MAWMLLGTTADALGLRLRALRAQAESRWLLGDLTGAMDRLRTGRTLARSGAAGQEFIEVSIIDARLRELESLRRQQLAEQRGGRGERGERSDDKDRGSGGGSDSAKDGEARPPSL
jgi:predicted Zn-dependent protease